MKNDGSVSIRESVRLEYESARAAFHGVLDSLSEADLKTRSKNPGWTNGEVLFHVTLGFQIILTLLPMAMFFSRLPKSWSRIFATVLNAFTWLFNPVNAAGARGGAVIYRRDNIGPRFDRLIDALLKKLNSIKDGDWQKGMYYPKRWDPLFSEFMTLEKLFRYPVEHCRFHLKQISPGQAESITPSP